MAFAEHFDRFPPIGGFGDELHVRLVGENRGDAFSDQRVIVDAQHANGAIGTACHSYDLHHDGDRRAPAWRARHVEFRADVRRPLFHPDETVVADRRGSRVIESRAIVRH